MAKKPEEKKAATTPPAEKKEGVPLIFAAMAAVLKDIPAVGKDSTNKQQGWKFRGIDAIYNAINSVMAKHKVICIPTVIGDPVREERKSAANKALFHITLTVKYTFYAEDGSSVEAVVVGEAMDSGDKVANKALAAAQKYALIQSFCIQTEGENGDADPDTTAHDVQPREETSPSTETKPAKRGTKAHMTSIADHYKLFVGAHGAQKAGMVLIEVTEFEKDGTMVPGFDTLESFKAWIQTKKTLGEAAPRIRVICHKIEAAWRKALKGEGEPPTTVEDDNIPF